MHTSVACAQLEPTCQCPCVSQSDLVVDFFTVSHIFLFLCAPGKLRVDARRLGFAFLGTEHPVLLAVHAPELFATHFSDLDPWKQIGLVLGQCFLRAPPVVLSELRFPLQLLETLPDPGELWGGGSLHSRSLCPKHRALGDPPELWSFVPGLCPPSWQHSLEAPPMSQAPVDHLYLFFLQNAVPHSPGYTV